MLASTIFIIALYEHNAPLVTGALAVATRNQLDLSPLEDGGLDKSNLYQRVSDIWGFYRKKNGTLCVVVSDLPSMYRGESLDKQLEAARKIGWGRTLSKNDKQDTGLLQRLFDTSGKRKAEITGNHWPHGAPVSSYSKDKIARAFLLEEAGTNAEYLARKGLDTGYFFLLAPQVPKELEDRSNVAIRPSGLGGGGYDDIYGVRVVGLARAGSVGAKNSP